MAKITRIYQRIFGSTAPVSGTGTVGEFGSLAAGTPTASTSVAVIQSLDAWLKGWLEAIVGDNGPPIEDMNGFGFVVTTQLAYIFQQGVPEWDTTTPYYKGSLVNSGGVLYTSLTDNNVGNALSSTTNWQVAGTRTVTVATGTTADASVADYYRVDASAGPITIALPALASSLGVKFRIKKIDSSANDVTVQGSASEFIDFGNIFRLGSPGDALEIVAQAAVWDII